MKRFYMILFLFLAGSLLAEPTPYLNAAREFKGPRVYKDQETGILFYVESDGRHVAAIAPEGKILWHRDPFVEAGLKPYRNDRPRIVYLGKPHEGMTKGREGKYISIGFDSTQFGIMDFKKGEFVFMGQD
jgi:hypothetical protein